MPLRLTFPPELSFSAHGEAIAALVARHRVVIVSGETGCGKSTQLPKLCLMLGRGVAGRIGHTQPRRIAARAVAARLAEETATRAGTAVGHCVRFDDNLAPVARVKVMTDGILLHEIDRDPPLLQYDTLIIDEIHERSLNIDVLLGYLKRLQARRQDPKLILTSATLDAGQFVDFFDAAASYTIPGRAHPIELRYQPPPDGGEAVATRWHRSRPRSRNCCTRRRATSRTDRARRRDLLAPRTVLQALYAERLPPAVLSRRDLMAWLRADPAHAYALFMHESEVTTAVHATVAGYQFPDRLELAGTTCTLSYRYAPGAPDDGLSVQVPLAVLPRLRAIWPRSNGGSSACAPIPARTGSSWQPWHRCGSVSWPCVRTAPRIRRTTRCNSCSRTVVSACSRPSSAARRRSIPRRWKRHWTPGPRARRARGSLHEAAGAPSRPVRAAVRAV